ncbi:Citrate synthase [Dirofilaria immitis]
MKYWDLFTLTTREWIIVFYSVIIAFIIISMAALIICVVRNCCHVILTNDEKLVERDIIITVPQEEPLITQSSHIEISDTHQIDENCPIHGRKKTL